MQSENKMFDDLVKMVNGFAGTMAGVGRDEFEAVKAMAVAARDENEALKARIVALEAKAGGAAKAAKPKAKPGAKS